MISCDRLLGSKLPNILENRKGIYCLYVRPSFREGLARLFDFSGHLVKYNYSRSEREADLRALSSDWQHVGEDIRAAIQDFEVFSEVST